MKNNILFAVGILSGIILSNSFTVFAAEKEQSVNINKSVGEAVFCFDFDALQNYDITIKTPSGELINNSITSDNAEIAIQNPETGDYQIHITADEEISVKSRVELKSEKAVSPNDNAVKVSSSISNLRLYFIDGKICGDWEDTNIGNVNVSITNPKNMQKLINETITGTNFSYEIPATVDELQIYLVPASSAKVEGAGISYTMSVVRELPAEVTFPDKVITNQDYVTVQVVLHDDFTVLVKENNAEVSSGKFEAGMYNLDIPLNGSDNDIVVYIIDGKGNINTYAYSIEKDIIAPSIKLNDDYDGIQTTMDFITIKGSVSGASSLMCDGYEVEVSQGKFSLDYPLESLGINEIVLQAADDAGNIAMITLLIEKVEEKNANLFVVFTPIILVLALLIALFLKRKKGLPTDSKEVDVSREPDSDTSMDNPEYIAMHDEMTELFNRAAYAERVKKLEGISHSVAFFDVNNLKKTNDSLGHKAGDKLLVTVAHEIQNAFPDNAFRIGGDEFVVLLEGNKLSVIKAGIDKIVKQLDKATKEDTDGISYQVAFGYAFGNRKVAVEKSVEKADNEMYCCKKNMKAKMPSNDELKKMADENVNGMRRKLSSKVQKMRRITNICSIISMLITVIAVVVLFRFCICNTIVKSGSMEPTLQTGDFVIFNRLAYVAHDVQRGDIINFWSDEYGMLFSKRVIGVGGDHIEFHDGYVFVNDMLCEESYIADGIETNSGKTFDVPEGCVFVLGDNRDDSVDSRYFENPYIPEESITGKYLGTIHNPLH